MRVGATPSRTYSERYGARSPWLVERWRVVIYLIWRALFAAFRPVLFVMLCLGAALLVYQGLATSAPALTLGQSQPLSQRFDDALHQAALSQGADDTVSDWQAELEHSLRPTRSGAPDIPRANSFAVSLPSLMGREALALYLLRGERRPELMLADLSAMPVWRRRQIINGVLDARMQSTAQSGRPVWLIEASPQTRRRYERAQALYGPSLRAAEAWFHNPEGQALNLDALPGVTVMGDADTALVLPDARELIVQGCALARAQNQRVPACERAPSGRVEADSVRAALALALHDPTLEPAPVRLALAARAAGRLEGGWLDTMLLGAPAPEREMQLLTALMPILAQADLYYARPETCRSACAAAVSEFNQRAGLDTDMRQRWFSAYDAIRQTEGALVAIRVSDVMGDGAAVERLALVSTISEGRLLAARIVLGPQLTEVGRSENFFRPDFTTAHFLFAALLAGLAMLLLGIVLISGRFRRSGGAPGALERLDGEVSRLILGRNL